tara:strand:- start:578 stop:922 length:345 start_codon:yes stop_codon:yes gene_type:complete
MSDINGSDINGRAHAENDGGRAEYWFAVMQSGAPTDQERAAFTQWRAADPANVRAYDALAQAWQRTGAHADDPEIQKLRRRALAGRSNIVVGKRHILSVIVLIVLFGLLLSSLL